MKSFPPSSMETILFISRLVLSSSSEIRLSYVQYAHPTPDLFSKQDLGSAVDPPAETPVAEQQAPPDLPDEREVENNKENEIDAEEEGFILLPMFRRY